MNNNKNNYYYNYYYYNEINLNKNSNKSATNFLGPTNMKITKTVTTISTVTTTKTTLNNNHDNSVGIVKVGLLDRAINMANSIWHFV